MGKIEINYKDKIYSMPTDWINVTISNYIEMANIPDNIDIVDKNILIVSVLTDINKEDIYELPHTELIKLLNSLQYIKEDMPDSIPASLTINETEYTLDKQIDKWSVAQFIDTERFLTDINKLHYLMAILWREVDSEGEIKKYNANDVEARALLFKDNMSIAYAISTQLFFLILDQTCLESTKGF